VIITQVEGGRPRLTITPDRVEAKIPMGLDTATCAEAILLFEKAVAEMGEVTQSWRGRVNTWPKGGMTLTLATDQDKQKRTIWGFVPPWRAAKQEFGADPLPKSSSKSLGL
jgi:hypothetical protein